MTNQNGRHVIRGVTPEAPLSVSRLVYRASTGSAYPQGETRCHICGLPTSEGKPVEEVIKHGFTAIDVLRATGSAIVCPACVYTKEQSAIRTQHYVVTSHTWRHLKREELAGVILHPPDPPFAIVIQQSHKKHTWLQARVNGNREQFWVSLEETPILLVPDKFRAIFIAVESLYHNGFSKDEIRSGTYQHKRIERIGLDRWMTLEAVLRSHRGALLMELALIVVNKPEDSKEVHANAETGESTPCLPGVSGGSTDHADGCARDTDRKITQQTLGF